MSRRSILWCALVLAIVPAAAQSSEPLRVIRIRSDRFDPRTWVAEAGSAVEALRSFLAEIAASAHADALPSAEAVAGTPFAMFDSLDAYQAGVLGGDTTR